MGELLNSGTAKVFMSGKSQAVRLPKAFRFDVDEVTVERKGKSLVLTPAEPKKFDWVAFQKSLPDWTEEEMQMLDEIGNPADPSEPIRPGIFDDWLEPEFELGNK
jgi:antitoxin VapB